MDTNKAKASYGVGMSIAESLSQQDLTALDLDQVMAGMHAIFNGIESAWCWGDGTRENVATNPIGCFACQVITPFFL